MNEHILVVEDDPEIRQLVSMTLAMEDYAVETASNGAEALHAIERDRPSLMLLDLQLPVLDGWGVAQRLREQGQRVPTVVMTAAGNARRRAAEIGADGYVSKPFSIDDLLAAVGRVWSQGQAHQANP